MCSYDGACHRAPDPSGVGAIHLLQRFAHPLMKARNGSMSRFLLAVCTLLCAAVLAPAKDDDEAVVPLHPAPLPSPALKYHLLPDLRSQTTGDALPLYKEALEKFQPLLNDATTRPGGYRIPIWIEKPLPEFPREEVRKTLEPFKEVLELVDKASRCERCLGEAPDGQSK